MIKFIDKGVCAPLGFKAASVFAGIKPGRTKNDLALIVSDVLANAAAVYTQNLVKGAPITVTQQNLKNGKAKAVICNSGIANTCNLDGIEKAQKMCEIAANALDISSEDVIVASTGVIGQSLNVEPIKRAIDTLVKSLSSENSSMAAEAIMTTDTVKKEFAVSVLINGQEVKIGGIAKGSGMINPNMATMLSFLTTDADIDSPLLAKLLKEAADISFNRVSVDGDTSTNDMLSIMANGKSSVKILENTEGCKLFKEALNTLCTALASLMAKDGEGATKLVECRVTGAPDLESANRVADSIINSLLVKTAMFGNDANWGRILCAIGYSGVPLNVDLIDVEYESREGSILLCKNGRGVDFSEAEALKILKCNEIIIRVSLNQGEISSSALGCDLSYDYVKINGDYRS